MDAAHVLSRRQMWRSLTTIVMIEVVAAHGEAMTTSAKPEVAAAHGEVPSNDAKSDVKCGRRSMAIRRMIRLRIRPFTL